MKRREAIRLRAIVETAAVSLDDRTASEAAALFPRLKGDGVLIKAGTRINWNGAIKRAAADVWDTAENNPDNAPALWEDIAYKDGWRMIPETITAAAAFAAGERGWWEGALYESLIEANVHTPAQHAAGWELVDDD